MKRRELLKGLLAAPLALLGWKKEKPRLFTKNELMAMTVGGQIVFEADDDNCIISLPNGKSAWFASGTMIAIEC